MLYLNHGGWYFEDRRDLVGGGSPDFHVGVVFGDFDNDSDLDLYMGGAGLATGAGPSLYYRNTLVEYGSLSFEDFTEASGAFMISSSQGMARADIDNDGHLDIWLPLKSRPYSFAVFG